jgi:NAD(P)-dependent dehydrogenase (short-subunit alcohol dehydrogenase family)
MRKIILITGSEGDIGKALVKRFKLMDDIVYGYDIKNNYDITDTTLMKICFEIIYKTHGKIDVLINNAGITGKSWDETLKVNLTTPYLLSNEVAKYMPEGSSIINITSLWSERGFENNQPYGASKGGLKMLTKCLACDLAPIVRVNSVGFGYIKTDMTKFSWKHRNKEIQNRTLLKRWGKPEDVVGLIYFLTTEEASYITGQDFYVDGGWQANG